MARKKIEKDPFQLVPPCVYATKIIEARINPGRSLTVIFEITEGLHQGEKICKTILPGDHARVEVAHRTKHGVVSMSVPWFRYGE